jgi:starch phosphorylase
MTPALSSEAETESAKIAAFRELARDLRWTWSHASDALWRKIDERTWETTRSAWLVLQAVRRTRLAELAEDPSFRALVEQTIAARKAYLESSDARASAVLARGVPRVAYFSMEFGLGEALPLYAGGLGILAGDVLKTASDLGLPIIGIGLFYQSGYFRQLVDANGWQQESFPYNEPASLPIEPVQKKDGDWLHMELEFPGRVLRLRVWRANVGGIPLYLLDSNDPLNYPADRGITSQLYGGGQEMRFMQELVLGVAGWRLVEAVAADVEICHINEGHAAFAVVERTRQFMLRTGLSFREAFSATRAGNVFTTHTPVDAGFDRYPPGLISQYVPNVQRLNEMGLTWEEALAFGRAHPNDQSEPFNMAFLAMRGSLQTFGVSQRHAAVSRRIFAPLFPRWPEREVPIGHVTNGVHVPTWDSLWADRIWTECCGRERWRAESAALGDAIAALTDERLWSLRAEERADLVKYVRGRLLWQLGARSAPPEAITAAEHIFDPNILTLGFARRFAAYKRPNLLLKDAERLARLLSDPHHPAQLVVAGKAHPHDIEGKAMIQEWVRFAARPDMRSRVVFLEDYDIALAQQLAEGVDLWINTPRPPMEACGTSGMKVLVNGGLNLSVRDGWWAEAYQPGLGWALGEAVLQPGASARDDDDAENLYALLEREVIPEFYDRDATGLPRNWIQRIRHSMATLTIAFSSNRMMLDYVERAYLPAARRLRERTASAGALCRDLVAWSDRLQRHWGEVRIGQPRTAQDTNGSGFVVPVYLGEITPDDVRVELYADPIDETSAPAVVLLDRGDAIAGAANGFLYRGSVSAARSPNDYTARVIPAHSHAVVPLELPLIQWKEWPDR